MAVVILVKYVGEVFSEYWCRQKLKCFSPTSFTNIRIAFYSTTLIAFFEILSCKLQHATNLIILDNN